MEILKGHRFEGGYKGGKNELRVDLILIQFKDENNIHFIHSPHLDLTGYGLSLEEAKASFQIVLKGFIDYTLQKKTLWAILSDLGWKLKGSSIFDKASS